MLTKEEVEALLTELGYDTERAAEVYNTNQTSAPGSATAGKWLDYITGNKKGR